MVERGERADPVSFYDTDQAIDARRSYSNAWKRINAFMAVDIEDNSEEARGAAEKTWDLFNRLWNCRLEFGDDVDLALDGHYALIEHTPPAEQLFTAEQIEKRQNPFAKPLLDRFEQIWQGKVAEPADAANSLLDFAARQFATLKEQPRSYKFDKQNVQFALYAVLSEGIFSRPIEG